jgi:hypothetical protein
MPDRSPSLPARKALARWENEGGAREQVDTALPGPVLDLATRLGVETGSLVHRVSLTQSGDMRLGKSTRRSRFHAWQTIALGETDFEWRASFGPFGAVSVTDAYREGAGRLDVCLFGIISLAHMAGPAFAKGEIMRYLAEIALAPDAILMNGSLTWSVIDDRTLSVAGGSGAGHGSVRIDLDDEGRIGGIFAPDRPFADGKIVKERPWSGRFFDYRRHAGRWLPFGAEVGWMIDGQVVSYWRGTMTSWSIV